MKVKWFYLVHFNTKTKIVCYSIFLIIGYSHNVVLLIMNQLVLF